MDSAGRAAKFADGTTKKARGVRVHNLLPYAKLS